MNISDFNYELPVEMVAQEFVEPRDYSKLMVIDNKNQENSIQHKKFYDIIDYLNEGDVLVLNDTKVGKFKIEGVKKTGAKSTIIIEKAVEDTYLCKIIRGHPKIQNKYFFPHGLEGRIVKMIGLDNFFIRFNKDLPEYLEKYGKIPLPYYVKNKSIDENRYQTIFSKEGSSLAAPTAGLHFTKALLKTIRSKGVQIAHVRLDISFSTFIQVKESNIENKKLHEEEIEINEYDAQLINNRKGKLVVCGTTSLRTLESCSENGKVIPQKKITDLFIFPGYEFNLKPDMLITNFHLPKSSLLMMVAAYAGKEEILKAYDEAIKNNYRFYSLGDAMLIRS